MTAIVRQAPWSLLQAQWLDVPIGANSADLTWGTFSEGFEDCLREVALHVGRHLEGRERLESVVTDVVVANLDLLVSRIGQPEKLERLLIAADRLIARTGSALEARDATGRSGMSGT